MDDDNEGKKKGPTIVDLRSARPIAEELLPQVSCLISKKNGHMRGVYWYDFLELGVFSLPTGVTTLELVWPHLNVLVNGSRLDGLVPLVMARAIDRLREGTDGRFHVDEIQLIEGRGHLMLTQEGIQRDYWANAFCRSTAPWIDTLSRFMQGSEETIAAGLQETLHFCLHRQVGFREFMMKLREEVEVLPIRDGAEVKVIHDGYVETVTNFLTKVEEGR